MEFETIFEKKLQTQKLIRQEILNSLKKKIHSLEDDIEFYRKYCFSDNYYAHQLNISVEKYKNFLLQFHNYEQILENY